MSSRYDTYRTHHQSRRLHGFDYAQPGAYFVTVCTHDRVCVFGEIAVGQMCLNEVGRVVQAEWLRSEQMRAEMVLDAFVVMPNHLHGIVVIVPPDAAPSHDPCDPSGYHLEIVANPAVAATGRSTLPPDKHRTPGPPPKSLGAFVAGFKSAATKRINILRGTPGAPVWQRGFYDSILRTERAWHACRHYIDQNPACWDDDTNHPERL